MDISRVCRVKVYFIIFRFLELCYKKLVLKKNSLSDKCGFLRINEESVVPFIVKDKTRYVPFFYFEGEKNQLTLKSNLVIDSWDLAYLKFCFKVQGISNELFSSDTCHMVAMEEIKEFLQPGSRFEEYWPDNASIKPVNPQ